MKTLQPLILHGFGYLKVILLKLIKETNTSHTILHSIHAVCGGSGQESGGLGSLRCHVKTGISLVCGGADHSLTMYTYIHENIAFS